MDRTTYPGVSFSGSSLGHHKHREDHHERKHRIRNFFRAPETDNFHSEHSRPVRDSYSDDEDDCECRSPKPWRAPLHTPVETRPRADTAPTSRFRSPNTPEHVSADHGFLERPQGTDKISKHMDSPVNPTNPLNILQNAATTSATSKASSSSPFQKILNFRDIAESDPHRIISGRIFRSGLIHAATDVDFETLIKNYGIKTCIDLRSSDEIRQHPSQYYEKYFPTNRALLGKTRCRVHCPLWRVSMNFKILIEAKKYRTVGQIAKSFATGQREAGIKLLLSEMNEIKLPGMYRCFIKYVQAEIKDAMDICADPNNQPILIHCSLGKDRTGVMSALISDTIGIERQTIVREYSKSADNLFPAKEEMIANLRKYYLEEWLADSPPEVMVETFQYIEQTYGSVPSFLGTIGFDTEKQRAFKATMRK